MSTTPSLPIGRSKDLEVATPVLTVGFPLDLPQTPSFGMVAGFDRKFLGRYFSTTHLRVNLPTQRGEAGAPLLNFKGEVVGILVSSVDNGSACYALPIDAAEKIRGDFVRFGEARHGWVGINVAPAATPKWKARARNSPTSCPDTPAADCGAQTGRHSARRSGNTKVQRAGGCDRRVVLHHRRRHGADHGAARRRKADLDGRSGFPSGGASAANDRLAAVAAGDAARPRSHAVALDAVSQHRAELRPRRARARRASSLSRVCCRLLRPRAGSSSSCSRCRSPFRRAR